MHLLDKIVLPSARCAGRPTLTQGPMSVRGEIVAPDALRIRGSTYCAGRTARESIYPGVISDVPNGAKSTPENGRFAMPLFITQGRFTSRADWQGPRTGRPPFRGSANRRWEAGLALLHPR